MAWPSYYNAKACNDAEAELKQANKDGGKLMMNGFFDSPYGLKSDTIMRINR